MPTTNALCQVHTLEKKNNDDNANQQFTNGVIMSNLNGKMTPNPISDIFGFSRNTNLLEMTMRLFPYYIQTYVQIVIYSIHKLTVHLETTSHSVTYLEYHIILSDLIIKTIQNNFRKQLAIKPNNKPLIKLSSYSHIFREILLYIPYESTFILGIHSFQKYSKIHFTGIQNVRLSGTIKPFPIKSQFVEIRHWRGVRRLLQSRDIHFNRTNPVFTMLVDFIGLDNLEFLAKAFAPQQTSRITPSQPWTRECHEIERKKKNEKRRVRRLKNRKKWQRLKKTATSEKTEDSEIEHV